VKYDRWEALVGQPFTCSVEISRVGFRGYGMLLAEVGLPPGVDVDRASLERAEHDTPRPFWWSEVLPDRVRFYVWPPGSGGNRWSFVFRPRMRMTAKTTRSHE
jgi:hypothetical protein